jgi:Spy/CpxP family protein refolding chaperone
MRTTLRIAALLLPLAFAAPGVALAQSSMSTQAAASPNPAQVQTAVKNALQSVNLTMRQKMQIKPMIESYQQQTANASAADKKTAQEALLKKIYGVLTPDQQTQFKASLKASMASSMSH